MSSVFPNMTEDDGRKSWDPERYDPGGDIDTCQKCGEWLRGNGDGATLGKYCPNCEAQVLVR